MKPIKMLVFDIDGTLIPRGEEKIHAPVLAAIERARAKGLEVLIATGRAYYFIQEDIHASLHPDYYVAINGQCLLNKDGTIIERYDVPAPVVERVTQLCKKADVPFGIKCEDAVVCYNQFKRFHHAYLKDRDVGNRLIDDTENTSYHKTHDLPMGIFLEEADHAIEAIREAVPELNFTWAYPGGYDVFVRGVDKTRTIESVLHKKGLTWENVMSFGDGENDLEMLQKAGIGVAMANGTEHIKACSDYITLSVNEDGIAAALEHFNLA